jgi:hypothetical protein
MDDYKRLQGFGINIKEIKSSGSRKGHLEELSAFYNSITVPGSQWPISFNEMIETTRLTILIQ